MAEDKTARGKIIKISRAGGWGFITSEDIKFRKIFFHWTALRQDTLTFDKLAPGMAVEFVPMQNETQGFRAANVKVIEK